MKTCQVLVGSCCWSLGFQERKRVDVKDFEYDAEHTALAKSNTQTPGATPAPCLSLPAASAFQACMSACKCLLLLTASLRLPGGKLSQAARGLGSRIAGHKYRENLLGLGTCMACS